MNSDQLIKDLTMIRSIGRKKPYNWEAFMRKYNCDVICEVGVCKGTNFSEMIKHSPKLAVAIDSWINDGTISRNDGGYTQEMLNQQHDEFVKSMNDKKFVEVYREYSFNAVKRFSDNFFDLIYIDADHSFEGCLKDINDWYPKIKSGGFLLGDDYRIYEGRRPGIKFGVIEAVNEFAKKNNLKFFLLPNYGWAIIKV
jgi:hypothetical protein